MLFVPCAFLSQPPPCCARCSMAKLRLPQARARLFFILLRVPPPVHHAVCPSAHGHAPRHILLPCAHAIRCQPRVAATNSGRCGSAAPSTVHHATAGENPPPPSSSPSSPCSFIADVTVIPPPRYAACRRRPPTPSFPEQRDEPAIAPAVRPRRPSPELIPRDAPACCPAEVQSQRDAAPSPPTGDVHARRHFTSPAARRSSASRKRRRVVMKELRSRCRTQFSRLQNVAFTVKRRVRRYGGKI